MATGLIIDEGTSSTRAAIYFDDLTRTPFEQLEVPLISPRPDIVEQDANLIWKRTFEVARSAYKGHNPNYIGITNQRETTIIWDRNTGLPIYNALVWQDRRGADLCEKLKLNGKEQILHQKTGLLADPYFSAFKINWLFNNIDGLRARAMAGDICFGTVDSWLIFNLTEGKSHVTDVSNASRTAIFNIFENKWDEELLDLFEIPHTILPKVLSSDAVFGECTLFGGNIPITGVLGDQQAALMGQNCQNFGEAKITFGTGAFLMVQLGEKPKFSNNSMLLTVSSKIGDKVNYALEGAVLNSGTAIKWLRDELGIIQSANETESLANSISDNGGVYFVPALTGLGAPYWNADARGMITGLGRGTNKAHIARAALEAGAYQTYDLLRAIENDGVNLSVLRVDGGMAANNFFCQFLSDICNLVVERPNDLEMTAMGAARIASGLKSVRQKTTQFTPKISSDLRQSLIQGWQKAINAVIQMT